MRRASAERDTKTRRYWCLVAAGLCVYCGTHPARQDKRTCLQCGVKESANCQARYQREKAGGICHICHRRKAYQRRSTCLECYLRRQRRLALASVS